MEKEKIGSENTKLIKIELNKFGDYIIVSPDSPAFFDRFVAGYKRITDMAYEVPAKLEEITKKYGRKDDFSTVMDRAKEISAANVGFSREAVVIIDEIFGADTVKKYFRNVYEEIPDFLPDADCIMDFFDQMAPVIEKLFGQKIERQQAASKARMAKYKPQDHKKPQRKSATQ